MPLRYLRKVENFDLARLNLVGWLLFFICVGLVIVAIILMIGSPIDPGDGDGFVHGLKAHAISYGMLAMAALVFVGARSILSQFGISIIRNPKKLDKDVRKRGTVV